MIQDSDTEFEIETLSVRAGSKRSQFNEHSEALYLTSSFVFSNAQEAAERFSGDADGMVYSRYTNPSLEMFEERLAALENGDVAISTSSGMSAILAVVMSLLESGDHIVASANIFGASRQLFSNFLRKFQIHTTFVHSSDVDEWDNAVTDKTRLFFLETPSNPLMQIIDLRDWVSLAQKRDIITVVDNCFCTPVFQRPLDFGVDIVVHSATKYLDGQGRVLGGAVVGKSDLVEKPVRAFLRTTGATLSPFNAWVLFKGLETLKLRMEAHAKSAFNIATWLENHDKVSRVFYPWLASHPQYELARKQQTGGGGIVSFDVGDRKRAWGLIDNVKLISITANLGDTRSTITHPASTTHGRVPESDRLAAGITEGLIRVAVGLEGVADLQSDLEDALARI